MSLVGMGHGSIIIKLAQMLTLYVALAATITVNDQKGFLNVSTSNMVITKILSQYSDYSIIIHIDNSTSQHAYKFDDDMFNSAQGTLVQNYDKRPVFNRPVGYKFINVVFLENLFRFEEFAKTMFNFEYNDVILIISIQKIFTNQSFVNAKILPFWQQQGLDKAGSVLVLDLTTSELYHECFYCGSMSKVLIKASSGEIEASVRDYLNDFTNFYGHHFKVGYMPYLPFFWCEKSAKGCRVAGSEGQLLDALSETLNFKYSVKSFEDYVGGQWRALVDAVHYQRLDWAVGGISSSPERGQLTDLTKSIHTEVYIALYYSGAFKDSWKSWRQILLPFNPSLWLCIWSVLIFISILLKNVPDYLKDNSSTSIFKFYEISIRGLVDQPLMKIPIKSMTKRVLLISWWYVAIIIATAYRSKLASSLIHPNNNQPRSIIELLKNGYSFQVNNEDWTVLKESLEGSVEIEPAYTEILKRTNDNLNICSSVMQTIEHKVAVIDEATTLQHEVIANCRELFSPYGFSHLRVVEEQVFPSYHIWPMQLGAPYRHRFSTLIEDLHSSGILERWYNLASKKHLPVGNRHVKIDSADALTMSTMTAPALILLVGSFVAVIVFTCEVVYVTMSNLINFYRKHNYVRNLNSW